MFLILAAALVGTAAAAPLLWPYGLLATVLLSPFGGSLFALLAAAWVTLSTDPETALTMRCNGFEE